MGAYHQEFTRAYIECMLWSSTDDSTPQGGDPLDANYSADDISPDAMEKIVDECNRFQSENRRYLRYRNDSHGGHDFWLTRNRHGCGFWETPEWPELSGRKLTKAAHAFGEQNPYVHEGKIYLD